jgi:hypothetical protein
VCLIPSDAIELRADSAAYPAAESAKTAPCVISQTVFLVYVFPHSRHPTVVTLGLYHAEIVLLNYCRHGKTMGLAFYQSCDHRFLEGTPDRILHPGASFSVSSRTNI